MKKLEALLSTIKESRSIDLQWIMREIFTALTMNHKEELTKEQVEHIAEKCVMHLLGSSKKNTSTFKKAVEAVAEHLHHSLDGITAPNKSDAMYLAKEVANLISEVAESADMDLQYVVKEDLTTEKEIEMLIEKVGVLKFAEDLEMALHKNVPDQKLLQSFVRRYINQMYK